MKINLYFKLTLLWLVLGLLVNELRGQSFNLANLSNQDQNLVIQVTLQREGIVNVTQFAGSTLTRDSLRAQIAYMDGLGRPIQSIAWQASPEGKDIVQIQAYDAYSRETKAYLPYVSSGLDGRYKTNALSDQSTFYNQSANLSAQSGDTWSSSLQLVQSYYPYAETQFEQAPLNRPLEQSAPGAPWRLLSGGAGKTMKTRYLVNQASDSIRIWDIGLATSATPQSPDFYMPGALIKNEVEDEHGHLTQEFKDQRGLVICKKVQSSEEGSPMSFLTTYYVYDDLDRLRFVLPPRAVDELSAHNWNYASAASQGDLEDLVFSYLYDHRGRMISKKVPGAGMSQMIYDILDRLVLSQDFVQKTRGEWIFTKYDSLSRPVMTGIYSDQRSRTDIQGDVSLGYSSHSITTQGAGSDVPPNRVYPDDFGYVDQTALHSYFARESLTLRAPSNGGSSYTADTNYDQRFGIGDPDASNGPAVTKSNVIDQVTVSSFPSSQYEAHSITYYDDYQFAGADDFTFENQFCTNCLPQYYSAVQGQVTASKVRGLNPDGSVSSEWLSTVSYYDDRYRVVQTVSENHQGGKDILATEYQNKMVPWVLRTLLRHQNPADIIRDSLVVTERITYDHRGRPLSVTHQIDQGPQEALCSFTYNPLGEMVSKELGENTSSQPLQKIDYQYNIRGWMTHINDAALSEAGDLFGMELYYDEGLNGFGSASTGAAQYNGNIAGVKWQSAQDGEERAYAYDYDPLNRLLKADYHKYHSSDNEDYSVGGNTGHIAYDANGNILNLHRQGLQSWDGNQDGISNKAYGAIDQLSYHYRGNQLIAVEDAAQGSEGVAGDFQDLHDYGQNAVDEYLYDGNGNMIRDENKQITSIRYNYLNLPGIIEFQHGGRIEYHYDAAGIKLQKQVFSEMGSLLSTTDYIGGFVYTDSELEFLATAEGRVLPEIRLGLSGSGFAYEYHYKDHLGNLRLAFRDPGPGPSYAVTMERVNEVEEEREFAYLQETRYMDSEKSRTGSYSAQLDEVHPLSMWKSLKMGKGDSITVSVHGRYEDNSPKSNPGSGLTAFINLLNLNPPNPQEQLNDPVQLQAGIGFSPVANPSNNQIPKAYLKFQFFDENGNFVESRVKTLSDLAYQGWEKLTLTYEANQSGTLQVFIASESEAEVWFDDLQMEVDPALVVQENHYYPFGLNLVGIEKQGQPDHKFQYNGKEKQEEFSLDWADYGARFYDAQLGRFSTIDPHAENYHDWNPYNYVANNPILMVDPDGKDWVITTLKGEGKGGRDLIKIQFTGAVIDERDQSKLSEKQIARREKSVQKFMEQLTKQIEKSFKGKDKDYEFVTEAVVRVVEDEKQVKENDHVIRLVDDISKVNSNEGKEAAGFASPGNRYAYVEGGRSLKDMVTTGAHELGHTAFLGHIKDESAITNPKKPNKLRQLTVDNYPGNLMHQNADRNSQEKAVQGTSLEAWQLRRILVNKKRLNIGRQKY